MCALLTLDDARLDLPPSPAARLHPPKGFGRRFVLFGDAEEEFEWGAGFRRDAVAVTAIAALPEATRRFNAAGVTPCYLVDYPVVDDPVSAAAMRGMVEAGECEIGTQLHPWVNPPFDEAVNERNSFTGNLPIDLQRAKLAALTGRIEEATGVRPLTYRAGRYGIGKHTAMLLRAQGYRMDVSVRALFDYSDGEGPDFSQHPPWPYRVASGLIELPLTATRIGALRSAARWREKPATRRWVGRTGLIGHVGLTPEGMPLKLALEALAALLDSDLPIFSLSFHTPSLVPGHTPYVRNAADLRQFWSWWDAIFDAFAKAGVTPVTSSAIIEALG